MNISELSEILKSSQHETDTYDFKERWENTNSELLKDILSFANTAHHKDCYLIYGIDDNKHVVGITDEDKNRKNQQMITDFLTHVHFANDSIPDVIFNRLPVDGKIVNILTIKDSDQVPFYLVDDFKGKGRPISKGTIFFRDKDSDFGFQSVPPYKTMEKLWQKHFHLDLKPKDRFPYLLDDICNWSWHDGDPEKFVYDIDPNFCIEIEEKEGQKTSTQVESFSLNLPNPKISWSSVSLKYNQQDVMNPLTGMSLDGDRGFAVYPEISKLKDLDFCYYYYFANSLREKVGNVVNYQRRHATGKVTIDDYFNSIVQYSDNKQRQLIESEIESKKIDFSPKAEEVKQLNEHLTTTFGKEYVERHTFSYMISQIKLTRYINKTINK
ncbi:helix-turn-helix domain-containing protein [Lactiplantibacillus pentosus]|uniref:AlbA family DNA-binding domain-containing protein n=1 Tax=Lactiplantibacillus pentosus TaxID=1589 RepID=UPI003C144D88